MAHEVVVGGGRHNGLICAAYLARAGLDTVVLEARDEVGGCASTIPALGARVNACNCDHLSIRTTPILEELELERHGLRYLDADPAQLSLLWEGGAPWFLFHDVERTLESLRLSCPGEVEGYRRYVTAALPVARLMLELALGVPTRLLLLALAARSPVAAARAVAWSRTSAEAVLRAFFSAEALVAPGGVIGPVLWGLAPSTPGTGLGALGYAVRHLARVGRPVGGSGALPAAIADAVRAAGGTVRTVARVAAVLADRSRVRGVRLESGEEIEAAAVVVACDPRRALVEWLREPPRGAVSLVERWRARAPGEGYQSKVDALVSEPPRYSALPDGLTERLGVADPLLPTAIVAPGGSGLDEAAGAMAAGRVASWPPAMVNVPSVLDPAMRAPGGQHVLSLEVLFTPYGLTGGLGRLGRAGALAGRARRPCTGRIPRRRRGAPCRHAGRMGERVLAGARPCARVRAQPARVARRARPRADSLRDTGAGSLPHRRGDVPGCRRLGRVRTQCRERRPAPALGVARAQVEVFAARADAQQP